MPDIGLCFKTVWESLGNPTEANYQKAKEALEKAKVIDGGKEIRLPMNYAKDKLKR